MRSGLNVAEAQHLVSQVKFSFEIIRHVTLNLLETTEAATLNRLSYSFGEPVNLKAMRTSIVFKLTHKVVVNRLEYNLSLSLPCELIEQNPIFKMIIPSEQALIQASMGSSQVRVNVLPLKSKKSYLKPKTWLNSTRRRVLHQC